VTSSTWQHTIKAVTMVGGLTATVSIIATAAGEVVLLASIAALTAASVILTATAVGVTCGRRQHLHKDDARADSLPPGVHLSGHATAPTTHDVEARLQVLHSRVLACEQRVDDGLRRFDSRWGDVDVLMDVANSLPLLPASGDRRDNVFRLPPRMPPENCG